MNILIFDTETIGKISQDVINLGYNIVDLNIQTSTYEVLKKRDYIDTKLINNKIYCLNDCFVGQKKYDMFIKALESKSAKKLSMIKAFNVLLNDIKKYNVLFAYAYNCKFDIGVLSKYGSFPIPVYDIQDYCYKAILTTKEYVTFCKDNELLTQSKFYIQRNVESLCKYLYNDLNFSEDHTALSDVQHETNILVECVKRGCDITRNCSEVVKNIKSDKILNFTYRNDGKTTTIIYKTSYNRDGITTYKM